MLPLNNSITLVNPRYGHRRRSVTSFIFENTVCYKTTLMAFLFAIVLLLLCTGCGAKGELYLPGDPLQNKESTAQSGQRLEAKKPETLLDTQPGAKLADPAPIEQLAEDLADNEKKANEKGRPANATTDTSQ